MERVKGVQLLTVELPAPLACRPIPVFQPSDYQDINEDHIDIDSNVCRETPSLKTGIKLPANDKHWEMANKYFKANINCGEASLASVIDNCIENVNEIVYNYFAENHRKVDEIIDSEKELILKKTKASQSNN